MLQNSIKESSLPATVGTIDSEIMVNAARYERMTEKEGEEEVKKRRQNGGTNDSLGDRATSAAELLGDNLSIARFRRFCFNCFWRLKCSIMCVHFGFDCCHSAPQLQVKDRKDYNTNCFLMYRKEHRLN